MSNPKLNIKEESSAKKTRSPPKKARVEQSVPRKKKLKTDADKAAEKSQHLRFGKAEITPDEASRMTKQQKRAMYAAAAARSAAHREIDQYEDDNVGTQALNEGVKSEEAVSDFSKNRYARKLKKKAKMQGKKSVRNAKSSPQKLTAAQDADASCTGEGGFNWLSRWRQKQDIRQSYYAAAHSGTAAQTAGGKAAKKKGLTVSFDGNFRSTLWSWEEARDFCTECLPYVDVLLGIEPYHLRKDETDHSKGDWKDGVPLQPSYEQQDEIFQHFIERYPNLKRIARHVRYAHSGSENSLKAFMWYEGHTFESKLFTFNILDRVGGGDAFASGLIYAMLHDYKAMDMINFAVASSAIKNTIHGDANITNDVSSIRNLMNMNYDIKR